MITIGLFEEHGIKGLLVSPLSLLLDILFLPINLVFLIEYLIHKIRGGK